MNEDQGTVARSVAYRWYRLHNPESGHREAWHFAQGHWKKFLLPQAQEQDGKLVDLPVAAE